MTVSKYTSVTILKHFDLKSRRRRDIMNKKLLTTSLLLVSGALVSCANTTVYPEGNGVYSLVATSSSEGTAQNAAKKKASEYCEKQGKQLIVMKHQSHYQGMNKDNQALIGVASAVLTGNSSAGTTMDDYKIELQFKCK